MDNEVLKTSADELYELVRSRKKISVEDAAKLLKIPDKTVQGLVDFLVEERIFGIEYKFTTPYIYLSQEKEKSIPTKSGPEKKLISKNEFYQKSQMWKIPPDKIKALWDKYLKENINYIKDEFYAKAKSRSISADKINMLWKSYLAELK